MLQHSAAAIEPAHLHLVVELDETLLVGWWFDEYAFDVLHERAAEDAVNVGRVDDFERRAELDLLDHRLGQLLADAAPIAPRIEHRHVYGLDIGRIKRSVTDHV